MQVEKIAILDFGSQYGKVIDRKVRELNVRSEIVSMDITLAELERDQFTAVIISGGPDSVNSTNAAFCDFQIFKSDLPILGICYGFQLINKFFDGTVAKECIREDGQVHINVDNKSPLFDGLEEEEMVLLTHGDSVIDESVSKEMNVIGRNGKFIAAIQHKTKKIYGVQFHPEVDLTTSGKTMLKNFLRNVCMFEGTFTLDEREQSCIEYIKNKVGDKKVLVMVSGGVDSTVCAALLNTALGHEQVICVHIDNGMMRLDESKKVVKSLEAIGLIVNFYSSYEDFINGYVVGCDGRHIKLCEVVEPELKRQIIGDTFIRVKDNVMKDLKLDANIFYAQGTLRPDLIESASSMVSGKADKIKTHHNDTKLVRELREKGLVVEPLKDFHKDEVRILGLNLGLPESIVHRHPFPGPGLAIRIICADKPFNEGHFDETQNLVNEMFQLNTYSPSELSQHEKILSLINSRDLDILMDSDCSQFTNTLCPIKTVGVQGDSRTYSYVLALSTNNDTIPWETLSKLAKIIPKVIHTINRVVFAFGPAFASININDVTTTYLTRDNIHNLQRADDLVTNVLNGFGENGEVGAFKPSIDLIQQMPVVQIPIHFDRVNGESSTKHSYVLRPFITNDFMTGTAAIPPLFPEEVLLEMARRISSTVPNTSRVLIDVNSKPPATTEWE